MCQLLQAKGKMKSPKKDDIDNDKSWYCDIISAIVFSQAGRIP